MSTRASKRSRGYPHPLVLQVRLAALTDDTPPRLLEPPTPPSLRISEEDFQALVVDLAERFRWLCWHDNDSRRNDAELPDLLLLRERLIWRELKTQKGRLSAEQAAWGERLLRGGQDWAIWRPQDWGLIVDTLTKERE
ncbi:MAG TPA: hypothetical protein VIL85_01660 [Thermomicrobiales bacterium]|jgi:hypothetical protein